MKAGLKMRAQRLVGSAILGLLIIVMIVLILQDDKRILESTTLLTILNGIFLTAVSLFTAVIALLGYFKIGLWRFLALGAGSIIFGMTALLAGPLMRVYGANVPITIYNIGSLLAAICYSTSVIHVGSISLTGKVSSKRILTTSVTLILTLAVIGLIVLLSLQYDLPPFFIQGYGSTPIRLVILGLVIVLFGGTAISIFRDYLETRTGFNYWFALGLFGITAGFMGVYVMNTAGDALNWAARFAQYIGNLYLLVAAMIGLGSVRSKSIASEELVAALFQEPGLNYRLIMDTDPNGIVVVNQQGKVIRWNRQAEFLFGYSGEEAAGSSLANLILPNDGDTVVKILKTLQEQNINKKENFTTDLVAHCKDGSIRPISFSMSGTNTSLGWMGVATIGDITERKKAEAKIAHLALFPHLNPNPVIELDISGHIVYANPEAMKHFPDLMALESEHPFLAAIENIIRNGEKQQVSTDIKIDDFWFEQVLFYDPTTPSYRLYIRDITVRKKAEEALSYALQHLNAHLENSPLAVIEFNAQFLVIRWSQEAERIFGWSSQEIVGRSISEMKWVYEDDVEKVDQVSSGFSSGETARGLSVNRNYRKDGSIIWCEWYNSSIYDSKGNLSSVLSQVLDITARKKAEEALVESEAKAKALIKYAPTGIYEIDFRGPSFLTVNDAVSVLTGYSTKELFAIGPMGLLEDDSRKIFADRIKRQLAGEKIDESVDYRVKKKDGSTILVELHVSFSTQSPNTVLVIGYDVTERRRAENALKQYAAELEASNKELETFAYSLSHDLRAPLRTLDGFSQAVLDDYGERLDDVGKDYLMRVRSAAQHMAQITEDMLKLSRVSRAELRVVPVNLSDKVSEICKGLSEKTPARKIEFIITPGVVVVGDPSLMQIALFNILDNAWKFTSKTVQTRIEFGADFRDHEKVYFVKDNGVGFDMKYAGKLFQPFQRLHSDNDYSGTGIGLATVQRVIKRHCGRIWVESELGKGTTINFTLGLSDSRA